MSTDAFYNLGKNALLEAQLKQAEKIETQWQFSREAMLTAIAALYGPELVGKLREHGVNASVSGTKAIVYGEFAFAPYNETGWCNMKPVFKFAVVNVSGEKYETWTGFTTVDKPEDLTRHVDNTREQIERQEAAERELAATPQSNWNADFIARIATRIRNKQYNQADNLILQFALFVNGYQAYHDDDDTAYDDDSDDE